MIWFGEFGECSKRYFFLSLWSKSEFYVKVLFHSGGQKIPQKDYILRNHLLTKNSVIILRDFMSSLAFFLTDWVTVKSSFFELSGNSKSFCLGGMGLPRTPKMRLRIRSETIDITNQNHSVSNTLLYSAAIITFCWAVKSKPVEEVIFP